MDQKALTDIGTPRDRMIHEPGHDLYKTPQNLPEPTVCPVCHAVYSQGRWTWIKPVPEGTYWTCCQACHRTADDFPAGLVSLSGNYVRKHRDQLIELARDLESAETAEHPLHRIMATEERPGSLVIKTTDLHLPHRIAEAIYDAHEGELHIHYDAEGFFIRADWHRDD